MATRKKPAPHLATATSGSTADRAAAGRPMLDALRERLRERRDALARRVATATDALNTLDESTPAEQEEEAQEQNMARLLAGLDQRGRAELEAIEYALARIELGDYGRCTNCGDEIDLERLLALPAARLCIGCAEEEETLRRQRAITATDVAEPEL